MKERLTALARGISIRDWILGAIILALLFGFVLRGCQRDRAIGDARGNAMRADSLKAVADTTRSMNEKAMKILADSMLRGVERLAIQGKIEKDNLDRALGRQTQAMAQVRFLLQSLQASGETSPVVEVGEIRKATFKVDETPYHATAKVELPPAPAPGKFSLSVTIDSAKIGVRIQCGKANATGIRPATVGVTTPPWLDAQIVNPIFTPDVCNAEKPRGWRIPWWTAPAALGVGVLGGMAVSK